MSYLPNLLTVLRIIITAVFIWFALHPGFENYILALGLFVSAIITDYFDGKLARRYASVSSFGKTMDPLADKLIVGASLVIFSLNGWLNWWLTGFILVREAGITVYRFYLLSKEITLPAEKLGKYKTGFQMGGIIGVWLIAIGDRVYPLLPSPNVGVVIVGIINLYFFAVMILTWWSALPYLQRREPGT